MINQKVTIEAKHDEKRTSTDGYLRNLSENISHRRNGATKWNRICSLTVFYLFWHLFFFDMEEIRTDTRSLLGGSGVVVPDSNRLKPPRWPATIERGPGTGASDTPGPSILALRKQTLRLKCRWTSFGQSRWWYERHIKITKRTINIITRTIKITTATSSW